MAESSIERIKKLQGEAAALLGAAKNDALAKINAALSELKELGVHYFISEQKPSKTRGRAAGKRNGTRQMKEDRACPVCEFATSPPHDARKHRFTQGKKKHPFSAKELSDLGMQKA
jgi:rubredoxin